MNKEFLSCLKSFDKGPNARKKEQHWWIDVIITSNTMVYVAMLKIVLMLFAILGLRSRPKYGAKTTFAESSCCKVVCNAKMQPHADYQTYYRI